MFYCLHERSLIEVVLYLSICLLFESIICHVVWCTNTHWIVFNYYVEWWCCHADVRFGHIYAFEWCRWHRGDHYIILSSEWLSSAWYSNILWVCTRFNVLLVVQLEILGIVYCAKRSHTKFCTLFLFSMKTFIKKWICVKGHSRLPDPIPFQLVICCTEVLFEGC